MQKETQTPPALTVDALAALAQSDVAAKGALWEAVKRWAYTISARYRPLAEANGGVTLEDLNQCAALGVLEALRKYNTENGGFLTWCVYYIRKECRNVLGLRGRQRKEHYFAARLDEPIPGAEDLTLLDCIPDENAGAPFDVVEDRACNDVLRADLLAALDKLTDQQRHMIHRHDLDGLTLKAAAAEIGVGVERGRQCRVNGMHKLKQDHALRMMYRPTQWRPKGVKTFNSSFSSIVEDEAFWRINEERRIAHYGKPRKRATGY